ncbi:hypothetical protein D8S78_23575 [Natrialba swarupiae]|nr:hypothetical protein [Natrialba swarupiae]
MGDSDDEDEAEEFPSDTIRTLIAFGEGGGTDIYARQIWGRYPNSGTFPSSSTTSPVPVE